jgi:hypothetical protein
LDDLRKAREREDHQNQVAAAAATEQKKQRVAEQRLHGGSRFNLRYQGAVPAGLTPGEVMAALADYVEFPFTDRVTRPGKAESPAERRPANAAIPRKGMSWQEAIEAFGAPAKQTSRMEGALKVTTAVFTREDQQIEAEFVEGVLIRYSIASK